MVKLKYLYIYNSFKRKKKKNYIHSVDRTRRKKKAEGSELYETSFKDIFETINGYQK